MKHLLYSPNKDNKYKIAVLVKEAAMTIDGVMQHYFEPLSKAGIPSDDIIALSVKYNEFGKAPMKLVKSHLDVILKACDALETTTLLVADSTYFKKLVGKTKAEPHHGYILKCAIKGYEHINVILSLNYKQLFYNPSLQDKMEMSIKTLVNHIAGTHVDLGQDIIHSSDYCHNLPRIRHWLKELHQYDELTVDIEAFSLQFNEAGIGTIAFAWDQHNGVAMTIDYKDEPNWITTTGPQIYGSQYDNWQAKALLKEFFLTYKGKLTYHGGTYDIKILIYELFMQNLLDNEGLIRGLECMYRSIDDTKLITYLATNTTAGNVLGLKPSAFEFTGNYAQEDIKDIRLIPLDDLLEYNLIDCLATWYVKGKNLPIMIQDNQQEIYDEIMIPSMKVITHMELTGMPMDLDHIMVMHEKLLSVILEQKEVFKRSQLVRDYEWTAQRVRCFTHNLLLKKKICPIEQFEERFNPASNKQVQELLYEEFGLPIIDKTDKGAPATGAKTLKKLLNHLTHKHNLTKEELL